MREKKRYNKSKRESDSLRKRQKNDLEQVSPPPPQTGAKKRKCVRERRIEKEKEKKKNIKKDFLSLFFQK